MSKISELARKYGKSIPNPRQFLYLGESRVLENPFYKGIQPIGKTILDCGCGTGNDVRQFRKDGYAMAIGLDSSIDTLKLGFNYYSDDEQLGDSFVLGDVCALPFPDESFDYTHSGSLTHTLYTEDNVRRHFKEANRALKRNGVIIGRCLGGKGDVENGKVKGLYLLTETETRQLLHEAGFEHIEMQTQKVNNDSKRARQEMERLKRLLPDKYEGREIPRFEYITFFRARKIA